MTTTPNNATAEIEKAVLLKVRNMLSNLVSGDTPFSDEVKALKADIDEALSAAQDDGLMLGHYRCTCCHWQWQNVDELCAAMECTNCGNEDVEPFYSGEPYEDDGAAIRALAYHENRFPAPDERGNYTVTVYRTAVRAAEIEISGAAGPANAQLKALCQAPDSAFSRDMTAEYSIDGYRKIHALKLGGCYHRVDPENPHPESDRGETLTIEGFHGELVRAKKADGTGVLVHYLELTPTT